MCRRESPGDFQMLTNIVLPMQIPRPPRKDFYKLMNKDKAVLRFVCRLVEHTGASNSHLSATDG
jgi:hypothetical protein